ncbi:MAG: HAMP domain-containing sensor histidine kinase [Pirellulales bacterium]
MRWPLRYQILLPFAGAMLAVVLGVSLLDAYLAARRTQDRIERQLHDVARTLLEANFPLTDAVLQQTRGLSGAEFVLAGADGRARATTLAARDRFEFGSAVPAAPRFTLDDTVEVDQESYFHTAVNVRSQAGNDQAMLLHILYPRRLLQEARWRAAYPPLVVGSLFLGVVIVLATVLTRRLSRPILELRKQVGRLVQGDFEPVPVPQRNDELRDLVESVNVLADQLDESRRAIERSERLALLGQLSGGLAHQLRNSVAGARLAIQLHQRRCGADDRDSLTVALRQLSLTESHLQRFLTVGQPAQPHRTPCDLRQLTGDVIELVGPTCRHRNVALEIDPDREQPPLISADSDQLRELLLNLVLNAVEAAGAGGWVRIEFDHRTDATVLRVVDSGTGPPADMLDRLFEPFATGKPDGIGLGLTVAQRIAEAHGGAIRFLAERPTCFEVNLPLAQAPGRPNAARTTVMHPGIEALG